MKNIAARFIIFALMATVVDATGEIIALPFRLVGGLVRAIF